MAYIINQDNYFQRLQPAKSEELVNVVEVAANPLAIQDFADEYYKTSTPIYIANGATITEEIKYSEAPLLDAEAHAYYVPETLTTEAPPIGQDLQYDDTTGKISSTELSTTTEYYAWGARVTVTNDFGADGFYVIVVSGYPLKPNKQIMTAQDDDSIAENGILKYKYSDNHLIQSRVIAQDIADELLATYVVPRKDVSLNWRGNQAIELLDEIQVPEYLKNGINTQGTFFIYKQQLEYDGTVTQKTDGRKIAATTTTTALPTTTAGP
jgi:hypothetical protein